MAINITNHFELKRSLRVPDPYEGPNLAELRALAEHALAEDEGIDFGPLSRAERDAELAKQFGL